MVDENENDRVTNCVLSLLHNTIQSVEEDERRNILLESILEISNDNETEKREEGLITTLSEKENENDMTLKELAEKIREKKLLNSIRESDDAFLTAVNTLISLDNVDYISSPIKNDSNEMDCAAPLHHLLKTFSPSAMRYMEKQDDKNEARGNVFNFVEAMSPNTVSLSYLASSYNNSYSNAYDETLQQGNVNSSNLSPFRQFYPGSMFAAPQQAKGSGELPNLDNYLTDVADDASSSKGKKLVSGKDYHDEVISSSEHGDAWSQINPLHGMMSETMLAPVMLSSHEEMTFLQHQIQQIQALNSQESNNSQQPYVLPVYFQPVMPIVTDQNNQEESEDEQMLDQAVPGEKRSVTWLTNQLLLNQYQLALNPDEESRSPNSSMNMKYLEEAAMKLLQNDIDMLSRPDDRSPGKFVCTICDRRFRRNFTLQAHQRTHSGDRPFKCRYCGQGFRQSGTKLNHERAVHTKEKPFKCEFCPKSFSHKSSATVHRRIHTKEKPFECLLCKRKFADRATYSKHQSVHSDVKPYECPICGNKFSQKSNLKRHFQNVHSLHAENLATAMSNNKKVISDPGR